MLSVLLTYDFIDKFSLSSFPLSYSFVLYVNGDRVVTDVSANDGLWHHVCILWQSNHGLWHLYLDGALRDNGSMLSPNNSILGMCFVFFFNDWSSSLETNVHILCDIPDYI